MIIHTYTKRVPAAAAVVKPGGKCSAWPRNRASAAASFRPIRYTHIQDTSPSIAIFRSVGQRLLCCSEECPSGLSLSLYISFFVSLSFFFHGPARERSARVRAHRAIVEYFMAAPRTPLCISVLRAQAVYADAWRRFRYILFLVEGWLLLVETLSRTLETLYRRDKGGFRSRAEFNVAPLRNSVAGQFRIKFFFYSTHIFQIRNARTTRARKKLRKHTQRNMDFHLATDFV